MSPEALRLLEEGLHMKVWFPILCLLAGLSAGFMAQTIRMKVQIANYQAKVDRLEELVDAWKYSSKSFELSNSKNEKAFEALKSLCWSVK